MKKIFLIAGLLISLFSQGQRLGQPLGALNGLVYTRGSFMADQGLINSRLDTLNHPLKDSSGALTFWQNKLWLRTKITPSLLKWIEVGTATNSTSDGNNYPTTLSVTGTTTKTITLTLVDGSVVTGTFNDLNTGIALTNYYTKAQTDSAIAVHSSSGGIGTVTNVATNTGTGITGGPITTTGTLAIDTNLISTKANVNKIKDTLLSVIGSSGGGTVLSVAKGIGIVKDGTITTTGTINADTTVLSTKNNITNTSNILQGNIISTATTINNRITNDSTILRNLINANGNGTVTSVVTNNATGITGGTITNTGTLSLDTTIVSTKANVTNATNGLQAQITTNTTAIGTEIIRLTNDSIYLKGLIDAKVIPAQFNPLAGTNMSITGTYPNITFNSTATGGTTQTTAAQTITATAGQTVFPFTFVPSTNTDFIIFVNGGRWNYTTGYTYSGNNITTTSALDLGDKISLVQIK